MIGQVMQLVSTVAVGAVAVVATSCGNDASPTRPTFASDCAASIVAPTPPTATLRPEHSAANYAGTWSGQYHVVGCSRVCGQGPSVCDDFLVPPGASWPLRLALSQADATVSGTLELFNNLGNRVVESGDVNGTIDSSGALTLFGITQTIDPSEPSESTIGHWNSTLGEAAAR